MRKRLILATVAVAVIACIVLGTLAMLSSRPGVTKANFDRIENGMSLAEVESIFGEKGAEIAFTCKGAGGGDEPHLLVYWTNKKEQTGIEFRDDGVICKWTDSESTFDKVRRWIYDK